MRKNFKIDRHSWDMLKEFCKEEGITLSKGFDIVIEKIKERALEEKKYVEAKEIRPRIDMDDDTFSILFSEARRKRMSASKLIELYIDDYIGHRRYEQLRSILETEKNEIEKLRNVGKELHEKMLEKG